MSIPEWLPIADAMPLTFEASMPSLVGANAVVFHTNGGGADLFDFFNNNFRRTNQRICSHFQILRDGTIQQFVSTARVAFAAYAANNFAWQVEMEDDGNPDTPLTDAQIASAIKICQSLPIEPRVADENGNGVGWHCEYESWNYDHHSCPGDVRIAQIKNDVIPALGKPAPVTPTPVVNWTVEIVDTLPVIALGAGMPPKSPNIYVKQMQALLEVHGHATISDGRFGQNTDMSLRAFQQAVGIVVDGICGKNSWAALLSVKVN